MEESELVYDLSEYEPDERAAVSRALVERDVEHWWEEDELIVLEPDQATVDLVLERLDHPMALAAQPDGGGVVAADVLSSMYLGADRLRKDPADTTGLEDLLGAVPAAERMPAPFGFVSADWDTMVLLAGELCDAAVAERPDFDRVRDLARTLRDRLRPLV